MNQVETSGSQQDTNVISLFREQKSDPFIEELDLSLELEEDVEIESESFVDRINIQLVNENHDSLSSMFIIENQLGNLRETLKKMKFYLDDLTDVLPLSKK